MFFHTLSQSFFWFSGFPSWIKFSNEKFPFWAQKGNFSLENLIQLGKPENQKKLWDRVWKNIYNRNMPPTNVPNPSDSEISTILSWIEETSFEHNPSQYDPDHVALRRPS